MKASKTYWVTRNELSFMCDVWALEHPPEFSKTEGMYYPVLGVERCELTVEGFERMFGICVERGERIKVEFSAEVLK